MNDFGLHAGMPNAQAHAPVVVCAQLVMNVDKFGVLSVAKMGGNVTLQQ